MDEDQEWLELDWLEHGGTQPSSDPEIGGTGIIQKLVSAAGGSLEFFWEKKGLNVKIKLPLEQIES